jgi:phage repressor protein C with HTH and peptisase S24 domain
MTIYNPSSEERQEVGEGVDISMYPAEVVEEIKAEVVEEMKEEMAIPIISREIANAPNTDIKKYVKDKADELERIYLGDLLPAGAKVAERVRKTSMLPTFQPGDWVFVKFINKDNITDGETYYFDFNTRPTMIRKVKIEGDNLRLIAKNPQFGDIIIKREEINNIGDIVGLFRGYFGDQYDDIEAMRRKKDEQVNTLIEQNGKALQIIEDLIKK